MILLSTVYFYILSLYLRGSPLLPGVLDLRQVMAAYVCSAAKCKIARNNLLSPPTVLCRVLE